MLFHRKNVYVKAPQYYVIFTSPVLYIQPPDLFLQIKFIYSKVFRHTHEILFRSRVIVKKKLPYARHKGIRGVEIQFHYSSLPSYMDVKQAASRPGRFYLLPRKSSRLTENVMKVTCSSDHNNHMSLIPVFLKLRETAAR